MWAADPSLPGIDSRVGLWWWVQCSCKTETAIEESGIEVITEMVCSATITGFYSKTSPFYRTPIILLRRRTYGIDEWAFNTGVYRHTETGYDIINPFPNIAEHVEQTPVVGLLAAYRVECVAGVIAIPSDGLGNRIFLTAIAVRGHVSVVSSSGGAGPSRVLPLGARRQPIPGTFVPVCVAMRISRAGVGVRE